MSCKMTFFAEFVSDVINYFFVNASRRSLHSSDDSSNYITVAREYVQNLEYKVEGARLDLYKNKEVHVCMLLENNNNIITIITF